MVHGLVIIVIQGQTGQIVLRPARVPVTTVCDLEGGTGLDGGPDELVHTVLGLVQEGGPLQAGLGLVAHEGDEGGAIVLVMTELTVVIGKSDLPSIVYYATAAVT